VHEGPATMISIGLPGGVIKLPPMSANQGCDES
jgi:hypothetical protein